MTFKINRRVFASGMVATGVAAILIAENRLKVEAKGITPRTHKIEIREFEFHQSRLELVQGDTIVWINKDIVPHTATASDNSWDTGTIEPGDEKRLLVSAAMTGSYFCVFHPMMIGNLVVS